MKILLDAGHGGADPGAVAGELKEKDFTLKCVLLMRDYLEKKDNNIILIREDDRTVSLTERIGIALRERPDTFISVHCNSSASPEARGFEVWFQDGDPTSERLAETICAAVKEEAKSIYLPKNWHRGTKRGNAMTRTNWYTFGARGQQNDVLIELPFISNVDDLKMLSGMSGNTLSTPMNILTPIISAIEAHLLENTVLPIERRIEMLQMELEIERAQRDGIIRDALRQRDVANALKRHIEHWARNHGLTQPEIDEFVRLAHEEVGR